MFRVNEPKRIVFRFSSVAFLIFLLAACSGAGHDEEGGVNEHGAEATDSSEVRSESLSNPEATPTASPGLNEISDEFIIVNSSEENYSVTRNHRIFHVYQYTATRNFLKFNAESLIIGMRFSEGPNNISGSIYEFDNNDWDEINKWVNNQISDGLYVDVPTPRETAIPEEYLSMNVISFVGLEVGTCGDEYERYDIEYSISPFTAREGLDIPLIQEETPVYLRIKDVDEDVSCSSY